MPESPLARRLPAPRPPSGAPPARSGASVVRPGASASRPRVSRALLLAGLLALLPGVAAAQANPYYPLQGVLSDSAGAPITGSLSVVFNLYVNETGGSTLWTETRSVTFDDGLFSLYLGEVTALSPSLFASNDGLWLGITVGADPEMDRVYLGSTPYSAYAEHAGNVTAAAILGPLSVAQLPNAATTGPQGCPGGSYAVGLDVGGNLTCLAGPTGANFATSNQSCAPGTVAVGLDVSGGLMCEPPYSAFDCPAGEVVSGFDVLGIPLCSPVGDALVGGGGPLVLPADVTITGDVTVTGTLSAGGQTLGYPTGPQMIFGRQDTFCTASSGSDVGFVTFPRRFAAPPVFVGTIDESLNDSGASWSRLHSLGRNRAGIRCNANADAYSWLAVDAGVQTVDQKMVQAGAVTGGVVNNQAVFFSTVFPTPPVVLVFIDETGNQSGGTLVRLISAVTTGGFQVWIDGTSDGLHWIAMEPGEYTYGPFHWYADAFVATGNTCAGSCVIPLPNGMFSEDVSVLATVNDTNNNGGTYVRARALSSSSMTLRLDAASEVVHYVAWERAD